MEIIVVKFNRKENTKPRNSWNEWPILGATTAVCPDWHLSRAQVMQAWPMLRGPLWRHRLVFFWQVIRSG